MPQASARGIPFGSVGVMPGAQRRIAFDNGGTPKSHGLLAETIEP